jgi:4-aminobutyrate aminotransferase/(S)-3-amino-2-methylpropionate transaminase
MIEEASQSGDEMPRTVTDIPGPKSVALVDVLAKHESPGVTARRARAGEARGVGADPIVWDKAVGANVWDVDGNRYVDLSGAFGVALIGHRHPRVQSAVEAQSGKLLHSMGDVYPNAARIRLMEKLGQMAPGDLSQCILTSSGSEAVEAALKTATLKSGKSGVLAFWGGYHGLSYGALAVTAYKDAFRRPFKAQLGGHVRHLPFGEDLSLIERFLEGPATGADSIGAILVEPIQGRGGEVVAPDAWLQGLRKLADRFDACLIFDEIYSGLGRSGKWWAGDWAGVTPDILCAGKALGGGMPIGACIARPDVMAAWGQSQGEAIHTSTFLGHPVSCAAALASLNVLEAMDAPALAMAIEKRVRARFGRLVRGRGAMLGIETGHAGHAAKIAGNLLKAGYIVLPGGVKNDIVGLTPPLVLTDPQWDGAFDALEAALSQEGIRP